MHFRLPQVLRKNVLDSLTQVVLGACVGAICAPVARRRRGALYGAALGTLPDLDVLLPAADAVGAMVEHRSFSHSLLLLTVLAPLLHWSLARIDPALREERHRWRLGFWLALITHPLLDLCTTYGTQLLWPLTTRPFALDSVFVIDPLYTLPLLLAALVVLCSADPQRQRRWLRGALVVSSAYLAFGLLAHAWVSSRVRAGLVDLQLPSDTPVHVAPAPLNALLWRVLVIDPSGGWYEGWFSVVSELKLQPLVHHAGLALPADTLPDLQRLASFSRGWYALREIDGQLWYADLRMGAHPWFGFRFALAQRDRSGRWQPLAPALQGPMARPPPDSLRWILRRIVSPEAVWPAAAVKDWQPAVDLNPPQPGAQNPQ